jgi:hypothetical protein
MESGTPVRRVKIGRRWWNLIVWPQDLEAEIVNASIALLRSKEAELLLVNALAGPVPESLAASLREFALRELIALSPAIEGIPPCCHVIGLPSKVQRFVDTVISKGSDPSDWSPRTFLDPTEIAPFPCACNEDPFGQNPRMVSEGWEGVARYFCGLIIQAHSAGNAISLPDAAAGFSPLLQPWREFASVAASEEDDWNSLSPPAEHYYPGLPASLDAIQRCLTALAALSVDEGNRVWEATAVALQDLGYLLLATHVDVEEIPEFQHYLGIGKFAAAAHKRQTLHGDLHPQNFAPFNDAIVTFDADTVRTLDRKLTVIECATDLAILRLHCSFEQWEAVKLGYSSVWPDRALEVFQLL